MRLTPWSTLPKLPAGSSHKRQGEPREGGYMYKESPGKEATCTRRAQGRRLQVQGEPREGGYKYKESPGKEATCTWPCFQFVSKHKLALNFV